LKNPFSVEGKVTIVTGGGTGIGESIAREFAQRGAPVLIASRKLENLERVRDEIRKTGGYRRPETEFAGLSGERVEYERWLLERALLDAKLIALGMQSIGVHYERMVTDDPDFGAARADTNFVDYHRELRANVHRSIEFIRRAQPGSVFNRGPKPVESSSQQDLGSRA